MFLTENLDESLNLDTLVNESYEYLIEYQDTIHELNMKMIKCEHTAIVNENSDMMMLAEEEYKFKVSSAAKAIWNKIVILIQNCIIEITKVIQFCRQKFKQFATPGYLQSIKKASQNRQDRKDDIEKAKQDAESDNRFIFIMEGLDIQFTLERSEPVMMSLAILNNPEDFTNAINETIKELVELKNKGFDKTKGNDIANNLKNAIADDMYGGDGSELNKRLYEHNKYKKDSVMLTNKHILNAYDLLTKHSQKWIQVLNTAKAEAKKEASMGSVIKDSDTAMSATYFQRTINKCIMFVQKLMSGCITILKRVLSVTYDYTKGTIHYNKDTRDIEGLN
jgi:hypothetical protein